MIVLIAQDRNTARETLFVALEPANIEKLRMGLPLALDGADFGVSFDVVVGYTADQEWVAQQTERGVNIVDAIEQSVYREPVYNRETCEKVRRIL